MSTTTTIYEIPLQPGVPQTFAVVLNGVTYNMTLRWCDPNQAWTLDIADASGNALVSGIALVTGADLLEQYGYLGIGGRLFVQTDNNADAVPTLANLGIAGHLYWWPS